MLIVTLINGIRAEVKGTIPGNGIEIIHPFTGAVVTASVSYIKSIETGGGLQTWERSLLKSWADSCRYDIYENGSSAVCVPTPPRYRTKVTALLANGAVLEVITCYVDTLLAKTNGPAPLRVHLTDVDRLIVQEVPA